MWLPEGITFMLDGKVFRDFKQPQVMQRINMKLFCLQLVCSYPMSTVEWHMKMLDGGKFSQATSAQWLETASARPYTQVEVRDVRVHSISSESIAKDPSQNLKLLFADGFDHDDALHDDMISQQPSGGE